MIPKHLYALLGLLFFLTLSTVSRGEIVERVSFQGVEDLIKEHDLTLVDLDGVVLVPPHFLCTPLWHDLHRQIHRTKQQDDIAKDFARCLSDVSYGPLEEPGIAMLSSAAKDHIVLGFTSRPDSAAAATEKWLRQARMNFHILSKESTFSYRGKNIMKSGIVYVGYDPKTAQRYSKGHALEELLNSNIVGKPIKKVLFIDDYRHHLEDVEAVCKKRGIAFTGIHFTKVNEILRKKNLSSENLKHIAETQFNAMVAGKKIPLDDAVLASAPVRRRLGEK